MALLMHLIQATAQNQTTTYRKIYTGSLHFVASLQTVEIDSLPSLRCFAVGWYNGDYILFDGRTNGLTNYPPQQQNQDFIVVNFRH